jgi:hypothetical protein
MIANRNVSVNSTTTVVRTVMTLDNGGEWSYISPPETDLSGVPILCEPPSCSLHFHMDTSAYARLGVYSQVCSYHNFNIIQYKRGLVYTLLYGRHPLLELS